MERFIILYYDASNTCIYSSIERVTYPTFKDIQALVPSDLKGHVIYAKVEKRVYL